MSRHLVIIPTYQEAKSIERVLQGVRAACDADVLVVDDASPDGTADLAEAQNTALGHIHVLRRAAKTGLGDAYRAGFAWGLERDYDVIAQMDADLSHDPAMVPALLAGTERADIVIGSRYAPGGSTPEWPWHRRQLSRWANRYARAMLRLPVRDVTAGFRAYRRDVLTSMDVLNTRADGYAWLVELTDRGWHAGATFHEVPIAFHDRDHGKSKMSSTVIVESMGLVTLWGIRRRVQSLVHRSRSRRNDSLRASSDGPTSRGTTLSDESIRSSRTEEPGGTA